jgi:hypothetical protein
LVEEDYAKRHQSATKREGEQILAQAMIFIHKENSNFKNAKNSVLQQVICRDVSLVWILMSMMWWIFDFY